MNSIKWALVVGLILAAVVGNYILADQLLVYRIIGVIALVGAAVLVFLQTEQGKVAWTFVRDAKIELRKVVWPDRRETMQATGIVILMVVVTSILLWIIDTFLLYMMAWVTGQGG